MSEVSSISIPVIDGQSLFYVVVPRMSTEAYDFMMQALERFEPAITKAADPLTLDQREAKGDGDDDRS